MHQDQLLNLLMNHLRSNSGFETDRRYLGMSQIAACPRFLYESYLNGREPTMETHRFCYVGYLFERDARARLEAAGLYRPPSITELVAPFDSRFRGHVDGQTVDGDLIEIKSVNEDAFGRIVTSARAKTEHFKQVQTYMRYGPWPRAIIIYISRDSFRHYTVSVPKMAGIGESMERKAKSILAAIDTRRPPACECGKCVRYE